VPYSKKIEHDTLKTQHWTRHGTCHMSCFNHVVSLSYRNIHAVFGHGDTVLWTLAVDVMRDYFYSYVDCMIGATENLKAHIFVLARGEKNTLLPAFVIFQLKLYIFVRKSASPMRLWRCLSRCTARPLFILCYSFLSYFLYFICFSCILMVLMLHVSCKDPFLFYLRFELHLLFHSNLIFSYN
jgi:hypothetical protein